jgi:hypothetical protein
MNETRASNGLKISPNPATDKISIELKTAEGKINGTVIVSGISGQELLRLQMLGSTDEIDVASIPPGLYLVKLMNDEKCVTGKFVKK